MGRVSGKVALITGAGRGVGRASCVRLAQEGADIVAVDISGAVRDTGYAATTSDDLQQTVQAVESAGRRAIARTADVRDQQALHAVVADALAEFGHLDIVGANAGIMAAGRAWEIDEEEWNDVLDVNLTGAWKTVKACVPPMIEAGRGGSIVMTCSIAGLKASPLTAHYAASKHGMVGLMRTLANELAEYRIRVNTINPTGIRSAMGMIPRIKELFEQHPHLRRSYGNALPVDRVEPEDISNALLFLASDEARYVTGATLPVDAGAAVI